MNWTDLPKDRQVELLHLLENNTGLNAKSIEKDWWVTLALKALFSGSYATHLVFKGGTSLSSGLPLWLVLTIQHINLSRYALYLLSRHGKTGRKTICLCRKI